MKKKLIALLAALMLTASVHTAENFFLVADELDQPRQLAIPADTPYPHFRAQPQHRTLCSPSQPNVRIPITFFDNNSDTIVVLGQSLPASKESMLGHAYLFDCDVIMFDYRWHESYKTFLLKALASCRPTQRILHDEEQEVRTVLNFIRTLKKYKRVIGLGECYSTYLFAKVQADETRARRQGPFTHLIFDSPWHSLRSFAESICNDPLLPLSPGKGGAPRVLKAVTSCPPVKHIILATTFAFLNDVCIEQHLAALTIPVLFIYGKNDLFVPEEHFSQIWGAAPRGLRAALITPYCHGENLNRESEELYRQVCERFIASSSVAEFLEQS
ncbi:alpha/beta hydrolase [Candidatus Babeliales bacterium]|nr:alpha/beta hydrolase [Candidatus Babeliales bacterium]